MARLSRNGAGNGNGAGGLRGPAPRGGGRLGGALAGPAYHNTAPRHNPYGSGPTTPRDTREGPDPRQKDSWNEPCGMPSETPDVPG